MYNYKKIFLLLEYVQYSLWTDINNLPLANFRNYSNSIPKYEPNADFNIISLNCDNDD